jgi:hypothetical protein
LKTTYLDCPQITILLISAFHVARISDVSHHHLTASMLLIWLMYNFRN